VREPWRPAAQVGTAGGNLQQAAIRPLHVLESDIQRDTMIADALSLSIDLERDRACNGTMTRSSPSREKPRSPVMSVDLGFRCGAGDENRTRVISLED
jgi:hypothetical protein